MRMISRASCSTDIHTARESRTHSLALEGARALDESPVGVCRVSSSRGLAPAPDPMRFNAATLLALCIASEPTRYLIVSAPKLAKIEYFLLPDTTPQPLIDTGLRSPQGLAEDKKSAAVLVIRGGVGALLAAEAKERRDLGPGPHASEHPMMVMVHEPTGNK